MKQLTAALLCIVTFSLSAVTWLDQQPDLANWSRRAPQDTLASSDKYVYHQGSSVNFRTPTYIWGSDMEKWPAFETKPAITDWTPYDRLVIFTFNPNNNTITFNSYISSQAQAKLQDGAKLRHIIGPAGYTPIVVNLKEFPEQVDQKAINLIHFYISMPSVDIEIYICGMCLLKAGEEIPNPSKTFSRDVIESFKQRINEDSAKEMAVLERISQGNSKVPAFKKEIAATIKRYWKVLSQRLSTIDQLPQTSEALEEFSRNQWKVSPEFSPHNISRLYLEKLLLDQGYSNPAMLVGTADSMTKILPKDCAFELDVSGQVALSMGRYEWESVQVVVTPSQDAPLTNVKVEVVDLKDAAGNALQAEVDLVGYVQTTSFPPYRVGNNYVGWWPDPIMRGRNCCDIEADVAQSFWVRLHASDSQPAGKYHGTIRVSADNAPEVLLPLEVTVRSFVLPKNTSMPTAVSFSTWNTTPINKSPNKAKLLYDYADFLADYQIDYDCLYIGSPQNWDILKYLHDQGRLTAFNLGYFATHDVKDDTFDTDIKKLIQRYRASYEKANELGILDHAYIYGADEVTEKEFPRLQRIAKALHEVYPDVVVMTTAWDESYGFETGVEDVDAWCPKNAFWDDALAKKAQANGDLIWWYICCDPWQPYANWFIEYPLIQTRLLMGAMSAKYRPDGFLYYATSRWFVEDGIDLKGSPFTTWNPVSYETYHGDGSIICADKDGNPLATVRLENYRDGLEDYAYAILLDAAIQKISALPELTAEQSAWLAKAKALVPVPENVVKDLKNFTGNPAAVRAWREAIAQAIDESGAAETLDPWQKGRMGVRGLRALQ